MGSLGAVFRSVVMVWSLLGTGQIFAQGALLLSGHLNFQAGAVHLDVEVSGPDLVRYHGLEAKGGNPYPRANLLQALLAQGQILAKGVHIIGRSGQQMEWTLVTTPVAQDLPAEGMTDGQLASWSYSYRFRTAWNDAEDFLTLWQDMRRSHLLVPTLLQLQIKDPQGQRWHKTLSDNGPKFHLSLKAPAKGQGPMGLGVGSESLFEDEFLGRFRPEAAFAEIFSRDKGVHRIEITLPHVMVRELLGQEKSKSGLLGAGERWETGPMALAFLEKGLQITGGCLLGQREWQYEDVLGRTLDREGSNRFASRFKAKVEILCQGTQRLNFSLNVFKAGLYQLPAVHYMPDRRRTLIFSVSQPDFDS